MDGEAVELVSGQGPLDDAIRQVFEGFRLAEEQRVALLFELSWHPTMAVVDVVVRELAACPAVQSLTLIHPSAAMNVIAAAIASRAPNVVVTSKRSIYDEPEDEEVEATESNTFFRMERRESLDGFVRRAVADARLREVRRFALVFDPESLPTLALADILVEELVQSGVRELGLVHPTARLDAIAASVRLRLANVRVAYGNERRG